jgi:hypothetical protein
MGAVRGPFQAPTAASWCLCSFRRLWVISRHPDSRQPELWPRPSHDAAGCGAVAAAICTGGVGLRPPCYGYQQACEDEAERCGR